MTKQKPLDALGPFGLPPSDRFETLSSYFDGMSRDGIERLIRYNRAQVRLLVQRRRQIDADERRRALAAEAVAKIAPSPLSPYGRRLLRLRARQRRDLETVRLARRGWSNEMIGKRIGVAPSTVSRIVQRSLAETRTGGPSASPQSPPSRFSPGSGSAPGSSAEPVSSPSISPGSPATEED